MRSALVPSVVQWTLQLNRSWNCWSCTVPPFWVPRRYLKGLSQQVLWEALPLGLFFHQELQLYSVWDARLVFLLTPFKQTVTLVLDAVSSDLETHWTKNVYNLFFPLDSLFYYWFSIFSTRLITSQIPIYIQILLNSASYILETFSSINQFFKERDSIIRSVPGDIKMAYREQAQGAHSLVGWAQLICEHNSYEVNVVGWYHMGKFIFYLLLWP